MSSEDVGRIQLNETEQDSTSLNAKILSQQEARREVDPKIRTGG